MSAPLQSFATLAARFQRVQVSTLLWLRKAKTNQEGAAPIHLRITIGGKRIEHSTGIRIAPDQWEASAGRIKGKSKLIQQQNEHLQLLKAHVPELVNLMKATGRKVTIKTLRQQLQSPSVGAAPCFIEICQRASDSRDKNNPSARAAACTALGAVAEWHGEGPLPLDEFTPKLAAEFYRWLLEVRKIKASSAATIIGSLSGLFRYAAEVGEVEIAEYPFRALRKRKPEASAARLRLSLDELAALRDAPLTGLAAIARDVYMAQYYLHGSRLGAVVTLRWEQVSATEVTFKAEKGGPRKTVAISPGLVAVLARYRPAVVVPGQLVFPVLPANFWGLSADERFQHRHRATSGLNFQLRKLGEKLGFAGTLHTHTARHTLAAHAAQGGGMEVAQGMLGHASTAQTAHYAGPQHSAGLALVERALYGEARPITSPEPPAAPEPGGVVRNLWAA